MQTRPYSCCSTIIQFFWAYHRNFCVSGVPICCSYRIMLKPVFHFNRIVPKRGVFLCFLTTRVELMTLTQKKMLRYVTIRLKWKTGLIDASMVLAKYIRKMFKCIE